MKMKVKQLLGILVLSLGMFSCKKSSFSAAPQTFVLVHGAWQAPFVWDSVKAQLSRAGQNVIVVQLPGHGTDTTNPGTITMDSYRDRIVSAVNSANGKVILVGHSLSGFAISSVEETIPDRIAKLVFLAGYIPSAGQVPLSLAMSDKQTHVIPGNPLIVDSVHGLLDFNRDSVAPIFCPDAPDVLKAKVVAGFRPDPVIPFTNPVAITSANFGRADKYYIRTLQDEVIGIDLQNRMIQTAGVTKVYSLNTSHSPFLSKPDSVTSILLTIAGVQR
ncbi:MAG: alpha/beta fold hydrolase [Bacteroidetes bacterium]|nr:alpha/beta fold hydrolase [Bacteroidota bacterium]